MSTSTFIVLEGPDGAGTTLHSKLLAERVKVAGLTPCLTAEPTDGSIGTWIREELRNGKLPADALQLLFCADRAEHLHRIVQPALERNEVVICDRYTLSTIVYGSAVGIDGNWLKEINEHFMIPTITFVVLPPLEVSLERLRRRSEHDSFEKEDLQKKIHAGYQQMLNDDASLIHIDSSGSKDATSELIWKHASATLGV